MLVSRVTLGAENTSAGGLVPRSLPTLFLMSNNLEVGGSERQFVALVEALDRACFHVQPACIRRTGALLSRVGRIPDFPLGGSFFRWRAQRARLELAGYLRRQNVVIAHAFDFYSNLMLLPTARVAGVPVVIGSHRQIGDLLTPLQFAAQKYAFWFCDQVVCNSHAAANRLERAGVPTEKIQVIPNGLPEVAFADCTPAIPRPPGVLRVGMIARINEPLKNHPAFLRVAALLAQQLPGLEFLIVGDGPLRPPLEAMAHDTGLRDKVIFAGERHDIPNLLASMDVSVQVSSSESMSNVILESMAAGVPVVAYDVGGNPELVHDEETGLLVRQNDEPELLRALYRLLTEHELRTRLGRNAKRFVRANFHMNTISRRFEQLYADLLNEKHVKVPN